MRRVLLLLALLAAATACQGKGSSAEPQPGETIAARDLLRPGALRVCSDMSRPPMEYRTRAGVRHGFEVDVAVEIARRLKLAPVWVNTSRVGLIEGLVRRRCDVVLSSLPVRLADQNRIAELPYLAVPVSLLVRDGAPPPLSVGLCGKRIGVFRQTREREVVSEYAAQCDSEGRRPLRAVLVGSTAEALGLLRAGRVDALLDEAPLNTWYARLSPDLYDDGGTLPSEEVQYAVGVAPHRDSLFFAVHGALLDLHADGTFAELLRRWALDRRGVEGVPLP
jgi:ABC-type amino acid transport substrate-binding protein